MAIYLISGILCHVHAQVGNTVYGDGTHSTGNYNSFFGYHTAGLFLGGDRNTAVGASALLNSGHESTVVGYYALNKGGSFCTAIGTYALTNNRKLFWDFETNDAGNYNTGVGYKSLASNDYGDYNTATGSYSLYFNTTGQMSTAGGYYALYSNTTGHLNTAMGGYALSDNISGSFNTATGYSALKKNNFGTYNTADGYLALNSNTTGSYNTASGTMALNKVASGSYNSGLGYRAGPATDAHLENTTSIGYLAVPTASNQVRIGNTSVTSIGGEVGWTAFSDGRFKKDIKEDVSGLDFINELRPVSYTVDKGGLNKFLHVTDSSSNQAETRTIPTRQTGFIAQEVEAIVKKTGYVFSGVDAPENENDPYGLRYAEFVVPLVKGMQELTAILKEQEQRIIAQEQKIDSLVNQLGSKSEIEKAVNDQAVLFQNNPNPFNAETEIKMTVPEDVGLATVMIYNLEGKQMKNIQVQDRGKVSVKISGRELSAGMYLYALIADGKVVDTKRMILTQ